MSERPLASMLAKPRKRRTQREMAQFHDELCRIAAVEPPSTLRGIFYRAVSAGVVEKSERGYASVGTAMGELRRSGRVPWDALTDGTRWRRQVSAFDSMEDAISDCARFYRRNLWRDQGVHLELWSEKDTLAGVVWEVIAEYGVPLMTTRGFASDSYLYESAQHLSKVKKPCFLFYLGDRDPSGVLIDRIVERKLKEFAPKAQIYFERLAVTEAQIELYDLPTRPTKRGSNRHSRSFVGDSVEVDAIPPAQLRAIVRAAIEQHIDERQLEICRTAEASERKHLLTIAKAVSREGAR